MPEILDSQQLADRLQVNVKQVQTLTAERKIPHIAVGPRTVRYNLDDVIAALRVTQHPDDDAIDAFAAELRKRMTEKREQGRNGWEHCDVDELGLKLLRSIADGDPIDVDNYAMMISTLGGGTEHVLQKHTDTVLYEFRLGLRVIPEQAVEQWNNIAEAARRVLAAWQDENGSIKPALERLAKELSR